MPRLTIIQATGYRAYGSRERYRLRKRKLVGAVLPYLAALAPREWDVTLVDGATEEIDFAADADVDVVALTLRTVTSLRGCATRRTSSSAAWRRSGGTSTAWVRRIRRLPIPFRQSHWAAWNLHFLQSKVAGNLDRMRDFTEF